MTHDSLYIPLSHLVRWEPIQTAVREAEQTGFSGVGVVALLVFILLIAGLGIFIAKRG